MSGKAVGRAAAALPWLCPNTDSLIRLAEAPAGLVRPCAADPALLAFLLRSHSTRPATTDDIFSVRFVARVLVASGSRGGVPCSRSPDGWVHPTSEVVATVPHAHRSRCSALARRLAEHTRRACPERAFAVATRLRWAGWRSRQLIPVSPRSRCTTRKRRRTEVQAAVWELDQNAIARRLAYRWRLPDWIATILGNLDMPLAAARAVVADADLFAIVQLAVPRNRTPNAFAGVSRRPLTARRCSMR